MKRIFVLIVLSLWILGASVAAASGGESLALGDDADQASVRAWVVVAEQALQNSKIQQLYASSVEQRLREFWHLTRALKCLQHLTCLTPHPRRIVLYHFQPGFKINLSHQANS